MSLAHLRPLRFGEILDGAFTLYRRHFLALFLTTAISFAPMAAAQALMLASVPAPGADQEVPENMGVVMSVLLLSALLTIVTWGALTRQMAQAYTGGVVSIGDGLRSGFRAFFPLLGAGILAYIGLLLAVFPIGIASALVIPALAGNAAAAVVFGLALVVGGLVWLYILMAMLFAVVPAIVVERKGPWKALQRSRILSKGARTRIVGLYVVSFLIIMLPMLGVMAAAGTLGTLFDPERAAAMSPGALFLQQALGFFSGTLTFPFFVGCMVLMYFDRRVRTEALDLEAAADRLPVLA